MSFRAVGSAAGAGRYPGETYPGAPNAGVPKAGDRASGGFGSGVVKPVQAIPSHQRVGASPQGSGYQPGGGATSPDGSVDCTSGVSASEGAHLGRNPRP